LGCNDEQVQAVIDLLPTGVSLVDGERHIVYRNACAEAITGYQSQEVVGRLWHDNLLMHCDEQGNMLCRSTCPLAATMHDGQNRQARVFLHHKLGHRVAVRVTTFTIHDEAGQIIGAGEMFDRQGNGNRRTADHLVGVLAPDSPQAAGSGEREVLSRIAQLLNQQGKFGILCVQIEHAGRFRDN
jgi:PAS domain S-box-containing protein